MAPCSVLLQRAAIPFLLSITLLSIPFRTAIAQPYFFVVGTPDTTNFPDVSAQFYAFDPQGRGVDALLPEQLRVTENQTDVSVSDVTCPPRSSAVPVSAVIAVDVSASMQAFEVGMTRLEMAKRSGKAWVNVMEGTDECAVISFADPPELNSDFTRDRTALHVALDRLHTGSSADFTKGLLAWANGGVSVAARGQHKRIVVLVTDGMSVIDTAQVIARALQAKTTIYAIVLGGVGDTDLHRVAQATGGLCFDGVRSVEEAQGIYHLIHRRAQGIEPCRVTWRSSLACTPHRSVGITWLTHGLHSSTYYSASEEVKGGLEIVPETLAFGIVNPGETGELSVTITAEDAPVDIQGILYVPPYLRVKELQDDPGLLPKSLAIGESLTFTLAFSPTQVVPLTGRIILQTSLCDRVAIEYSGGFLPEYRFPVQVLHPNGGELFGIGLDTVIQWGGVRSTDPVKLEYSIDSGTTWNLISARALGLRSPWNIPATPSNRCLVRVTQLNPDRTEYLLQHPHPVLAARFFSEENAVTLDDSGTVRIWYLGNGRPLVAMPSYGDHALVVSRDGRYAGTGGNSDGSVTIWSLAPPGVLQVIPETYLNGGAVNRNVKSPLCFTPDGESILTAKVERKSDVATTVVQVRDVRTGTVQKELRDPEIPCRVALYSPKGGLCAFGGLEGKIRIRSADLSQVVQTLRDPNGDIVQLAFSSDETEIISLAEAPGRWTFTLWDVAQGVRIKSVSFTHPVGSVDYSPIARSLLMAEDDAVIRDLFTDEIEREFLDHTGPVNSACFSEDGRMVITAGNDSTARVWKIDNDFPRTDLSDSLWAIIPPDVQSVDVEFGKVRIYRAKDSILSGYVQNMGTTSVQVKGMKITGPDRTDFALIGGTSPFRLAPGESRTVEMKFAPSGLGDREATIEFDIPGLSLRRRLHGVGVDAQLKIVGLLGERIDFGPVQLGEERDSLAWCVNVGTDVLEITELRHTGPDDEQFRIVGSSPDAPCLLPPGDSMQVLLRFAPTRLGYTQGGVAVGFNGDGSPTMFGLFGQGISPSDPAIAAPEAIDFSAQFCRPLPDTVALEIRNPGNAALELSSALIEGLHPGDFSLDPAFTPLSIAVGESRVLHVVFNPSNTGQRSGQLRLKSNAANAPEFTIQLRGSLQIADLRSDTDTLRLGRLCPEETMAVDVILRNAGFAGTAIRALLIDQSGGLIEVPDALLAIAEGESATFRVRVTALSEEGNVSGHLRFVDTLCGSVATVLLEGTVSIPAVKIDSVRMICRGEQVLLNASGAERYEWSPAEGLSCVDCSTPVAAPLRTTTYTVTGYDSDGCADRDSVTVQVQEGAEIIRAVIGRTYRAYPGDTVKVGVELYNTPPRLADAERLEMNFVYDPSVMIIDPYRVGDGIRATLLEGWDWNLLEAGSGVLRVEFLRNAGAPLTQSGILLELPCRPFLSRVQGSDLSFEIISSETPCLAFETESGYVGVDSVCGLPYRLIEIALTKYALGEVLPNPSYGPGRIAIPFSLALDGPARLEIFDARGENVALLVNSYLDAGTYGVDWDASRVGSGLYYYRLTAGDWTQTKRVTIVK